MLIAAEDLSLATLGRVQRSVSDRVAEFLLDKKTGNIQLNVKDGRILGLHVTEIVTITPD